MLTRIVVLLLASYLAFRMISPSVSADTFHITSVLANYVFDVIVFFQLIIS